MSSKFRLYLYFLLGALAVMGLAACILVPDGGGRDRDEHEDREHHDRDHDGEHRHDFGLEQREHLGLKALPNDDRIAKLLEVAVYVQPVTIQRARPLWA